MFKDFIYIHVSIPDEYIQTLYVVKLTLVETNLKATSNGTTVSMASVSS